MPYKLYVPRAYLDAESLGQSWAAGGTIDHEIGLCQYQTIEPVFRKYLPRAGKILEAGCGLGRWVFYLRRLGYDTCGVEYSRKALEAIHAYDPGAPIAFGDVKALEFQDDSLDAVISLGVVEHFEEGPEQVLRESVRVLKPGGCLLLTIPTLNPVRRLYVHPVLNLKQAVHKLRGKQYGFYEYRFGKREFLPYLESLGLDVVEIVPDDFAPPRSIGLWSDFPAFQKPGMQWELNGLGHAADRILRGLSLSLIAGGTLFVCKARK